MGLLSANYFFIHELSELGEFARITVAGLGRNLIELRVCLAADGFVICELFFLSTNLHESGELALIIVAGLGANLIELRVCLAADGFVPRICCFFLSTN